MRQYLLSLGCLALPLLCPCPAAAGESASVPPASEEVGRALPQSNRAQFKRRGLPPPPWDHLDPPQVSEPNSTTPHGRGRLGDGQGPQGGRPATSPPTEAQVDGGRFSNACRPPDPSYGASVPKTLEALRRQVGGGFRVARRGPFLVAADLDADAFSTLVDGVVACCRQCLGKDYFKRKPTKVITVYVFRNEATYRAHLRLLFHMEPISPYGHYGYSQRYIVVNYDTGPGTLVHEMTHALMAPDFPHAPIWISEGIASLYEQCRVENMSLKGDPNWRLPELQRALKQDRLTPLATLLAMSVSDFRAKHESLHYAQSRYFCKFMEERGVLRDVYQAFRDGFDKDRTGRTFVEKAFGVELGLIEREWRVWVRGQKWR